MDRIHPSHRTQTSRPHGDGTSDGRTIVDRAGCHDKNRSELAKQEANSPTEVPLASPNAID